MLWFEQLAFFNRKLLLVVILVYLFVLLLDENCFTGHPTLTHKGLEFCTGETPTLALPIGCSKKVRPRSCNGDHATSCVYKVFVPAFSFIFHWWYTLTEQIITDILRLLNSYCQKYVFHSGAPNSRFVMSYHTIYDLVLRDHDIWRSDEGAGSICKNSTTCEATTLSSEENKQNTR